MSSPLRLPGALLLAALTGCGGGEPADDTGMEAAGGESMAGEAIAVAGVGFATPESVLHDRAADVYLVSNINGSPAEADGNGFISRLSPDGEVLELKWIDGEAEGVTLSAPKGMAIQDGVLYVTDIDCVRMFDAATGAPAGEVCPEGATFLNDLAPHPEMGVLLTDMGVDASFQPTGADALYHLAGDQVAPILADPELGRPNGVAIHAGEAYVVTYGSGALLHVTGEDEFTQVLSVEDGQLDGIEFLVDGRALISNWSSSCVHLRATDGSMECAFPGLEAPADIGVDHQRGRVLVPLFNANEVRILPIG